MACLDHDSGVTFGQVEIGEKSNEIPMFSTLLDQIDDLTELVVTADALHAQREHAEYLHRRGAHYVITVKGNQKSLRTQLAGLPWKDVPIGHRETDTGHGRRVTRTYKVVTIAAGILFPHAAQAIQIIRTRKRKGSTKRATARDGIRDHLPDRRTGPARRTGPLHPRPLARGEQTALGPRRHDGRGRLTGHAPAAGPRMMAGIRNLAISLLRLAGHTNIAKALRHIRTKARNEPSN